MTRMRWRDAEAAAPAEGDAVTFDGVWIFPLHRAAVTTRAAVVTGAAAGNLVLTVVLLVQASLLAVTVPGSIVFWAPIPLLVLAACHVVAWRSDPMSHRRYLLLVLVAAACFAALTVAMAQSPAQAYAGTAGFVLSISKTVAVLASATSDRWTGGIAGALIGYVGVESTIAVTGLVVGLPYRLDVPPIVLTAGLMLSYALFPLARARARGATSTLDAAERRMRVRRVREFERRESVAHLHDTLLGTLAALSMREPGDLNDAERSMIERGLESSSMLPALRADPPSDGDADETADASSWIRGIGEAGGLRVVLDGDPSAIGRLPYPVADAVRNALEQCLVNVTRHANVTEAWVSIVAGDDEVSVTVVDEGVGFDPDAVPSDRLGLSESVRGRIERFGGRVRVWSTPGAGASVHISVPRGS